MIFGAVIALPAVPLAAAVSAEGCAPGRNAGRPQPPWWPQVRAIIVDNRQFFPPGIDLPFLGAWIEQESNGRHDAQSSLGEIGYFQLHLDEIADMAGEGNVAAVVADIASSRAKSVQWGGALLAHYDDAVVALGIARGSALYHGLLKVMHSSRPRGIAWLRHVKAALGHNPSSLEEFIATAIALDSGALPRRLDLPLPKTLPSCSPGNLLARRGTFVTAADRIADLQQQTNLDLVLRNTSALFLTAVGVLGQAPQAFPGVAFVSPIAGGFVSSGWGRPRPARNGTHEGLDFPAPVGTPVRAVAQGTVLRVTEAEFAGKFITIAHASGWVSRYLHLSQPLVEPGDRVGRGALVALSGDTGIGSSGPHLHFDLKLDPRQLAAYVAMFGMPATGFGRQGEDGVGVPAEPLIPVAGYAEIVIEDAVRNGIPLFVPLAAPPFPWGKTFAVVGASALVLTIGLTILEQRRQRA